MHAPRRGPAAPGHRRRQRAAVRAWRAGRCRAGRREPGRADLARQGGRRGRAGPGQARTDHRPGPFAARGRGSRHGAADPGRPAGQQAVRGDQAAGQEPAAGALPAASGQRGAARRARAGPGHLPHPDLAGAGSQPRGRDAPARDPGAGPAVRAGRADRRAHRPAARAQVRAQGRRPAALPAVQAAAPGPGRGDRPGQLGVRGRAQGDRRDRWPRSPRPAPLRLPRPPPARDRRRG